VTPPPIVAAIAAAAIGLAVTATPVPEPFLRPRGYFVAPNATITLPIFEGSFAASANAVAPARITDLSRLGPGGRTAIPRATWTAGAARSSVRVAFERPGTYVVGLALSAQPIAVDGAAFGRHLRERRLISLLDARRAAARSGTPVRVSAVGAAKTLIAVTDAAGHVAASADHVSAALAPLGYPAEIVPLVDPYARRVGGTVAVRAMAGGKPLAGWPLRAGGSIGTSTAPIPV
jgi:hypothetical protein